jgi:hypothetical protein
LERRIALEELTLFADAIRLRTAGPAFARRAIADKTFDDFRTTLQTDVMNPFYDSICAIQSMILKKRLCCCAERARSRELGQA